MIDESRSGPQPDDAVGAAVPWYLQAAGSAPAPAAPAPAVVPPPTAPSPAAASAPEPVGVPGQLGAAVPGATPWARESAPPAADAPMAGPAPAAPPARVEADVVPARAAVPIPSAAVPALPQQRPRLPPKALFWTAVVGVLAVAAIAVGFVLGRGPAEGTSTTVTGDSGVSDPVDSGVETGSSGTGSADPDEDTGVAPSPPVPPVTRGDLGLAVPISQPSCDSTWLVFLGAATDPATYRTDLTALLDSRPGVQYLLTEGGCSSMRQQLPDGSLIYAAYLGPYASQADACSVRAAVGGGAYVKRMDDVTPADQLWEC